MSHALLKFCVITPTLYLHTKSIYTVYWNLFLSLIFIDRIFLATKKSPINVCLFVGSSIVIRDVNRHGGFRLRPWRSGTAMLRLRAENFPSAMLRSAPQFFFHRHGPWRISAAAVFFSATAIFPPQRFFFRHSDFSAIDTIKWRLLDFPSNFLENADITKYLSVSLLALTSSISITHVE